MDRIDKKILALLQEDSTLAVADVARRAGLSTTPCWRRIQKLEEEGVIERRVAVLDEKKVNVGVTVFVSVNAPFHSSDWLDRFARVLARHPEIVAAYRMAGDVDYLLRVVLPDIAAYDSFLQRLTGEIEFGNAAATFAIEQIKHTTQLPLD